MQATGRTNGFGFGSFKVALVAVGILASTIVGTAAVTLINDTPDGVTARVTSPAVNDKTGYRFLEINQMPEASVTRVDAAQLRLMEINQLPIAPVVKVDVAQLRLMEINELPVAETVVPLQRYNYRFLEINQLPGDHDALVMPEVIRGTPS